MHRKYSDIPTQPDSHRNIGITNTLHAINSHVICGSFKPTNKHADGDGDGDGTGQDRMTSKCT